MFDSSRIVATRNALLAAALFATAAPIFAQAPTDAQKSAIRSACRADYQAHCASVTPGGAEALQCLNKNMSSLSSACQSAVRPIEPAAAPKTEAAPAAPKAESAPAAEPGKPAATTEAPKAETPKAAAAKQPGSAQVSVIKSACRSDYPKVCAGVPPGGAPALECLEKNKAKVSPACAKAVSAATGGGGAPAAAATAGAAPTAAAPAAAPTVIVLRPLRPREELLIVRSACGGDVRTLCAGVAPGGGRIAQCLATNAASLSPACKEVLAPFATR
ncbi:cysteine rich repeat-containing protein [Bradyrhizobium sp. CCGUVB23]|uniref:cysteine rich repeat-containing protein n=1 Tax=Bradyrhizobium sp. CCGUVB23 TaxID=2949630 RepID=UPI0020B246B9|nr:cysteine rich repeat-containing protein [Bradyrhizobium sp. CCGUVB23]MCP3462580.1 cysteine rich repeat-containing protein [Bradyrhizobium sp. CCGUVB23]